MEVEKEVIIGIDLAALEKNPTGWACWENKQISTCHLHSGEEIIRRTLNYKPQVVAIDAPLTTPKTGIMRQADRNMMKQGYPVFPPLMRSMRPLTKRAISLTQTLRVKRVSVIEVHPASTRKALDMPTKDWRKIQTVLKQIGLEGDIETRRLTPHEIDAITAALTAYLHLHGKTRKVGNEREGYIVIPKRGDWRQLRIE